MYLGVIAGGSQFLVAIENRRNELRARADGLGQQRRSQLARAATLEIRFGQGPKPDDANAYDANSTASSLRARIGG